MTPSLPEFSSPVAGLQTDPREPIKAAMHQLGAVGETSTNFAGYINKHTNNQFDVSDRGVQIPPDLVREKQGEPLAQDQTIAPVAFGPAWDVTRQLADGDRPLPPSQPGNRLPQNGEALPQQNGVGAKNDVEDPDIPDTRRNPKPLDEIAASITALSGEEFRPHEPDPDRKPPLDRLSHSSIKPARFVRDLKTEGAQRQAGPAIGPDSGSSLDDGVLRHGEITIPTAVGATDTPVPIASAAMAPTATGSGMPDTEHGDALPRPAEPRVFSLAQPAPRLDPALAVTLARDLQRAASPVGASDSSAQDNAVRVEVKTDFDPAKLVARREGSKQTAGLSPLHTSLDTSSDNAGPLQSALPAPMPSNAPGLSSTAQSAIAANSPQPAAPVSGSTSLSPAPIAQSEIATLIDQVFEARESGRNHRPELALQHKDFGLVNMRLDAAGGDLRATVSSRDPGFAPAIHAALAERTITASSDPQSSGSNKGQDGAAGQSAAQHNGSPAGSGRGSEPGYGSSTGSGFASHQPQSEQDTSEGRKPASQSKGEAGKAVPGPQSERGIFA